MLQGGVMQKFSNKLLYLLVNPQVPLQCLTTGATCNKVVKTTKSEVIKRFGYLSKYKGSSKCKTELVQENEVNLIHLQYGRNNAHLFRTLYIIPLVFHNLKRTVIKLPCLSHSSCMMVQGLMEASSMKRIMVQQICLYTSSCTNGNKSGKPPVEQKNYGPICKRPDKSEDKNKNPCSKSTKDLKPEKQEFCPPKNIATKISGPCDSAKKGDDKKKGICAPRETSTKPSQSLPCTKAEMKGPCSSPKTEAKTPAVAPVPKRACQKEQKKDTCTPKKDSCAPKKDTCTPKKDSCAPKKDTCTPKKEPCTPKKTEAWTPCPPQAETKKDKRFVCPPVKPIDKKPPEACAASQSKVKEKGRPPCPKVGEQKGRKAMPAGDIVKYMAIPLILLVVALLGYLICRLSSKDKEEQEGKEEEIPAGGKAKK